MTTEPNRPEGSSVLVAYAMLTLTMVFWAGNLTLGRWASGTIPPITLTFLRWSGAALLLLPFAWSALVKDAATIRANLKILLLLAIPGTGLFNTLQYIALTDTTASNGAIINSATPTMIVLMNFFMNREPISARQLLGIAISTLGVLCVLSKGSLETLSEFSVHTGDLVMLAALGLWAYYSVLLIRRPKISFLSFIFFAYAVAAVLNAGLAAIELALGAKLTWSFEAAAAVTYIAIFPSLLAFMFYSRAVEILGANRAGPTMHLMPVFTIILATTFLGESFGVHHATGLALILLGIYVTSVNSKTNIEGA